MTDIHPCDNSDDPDEGKLNIVLDETPSANKSHKSTTPQSKYNCHVCDESFSSISKYCKHIETHPDMCVSFKCQECNNEFKTQWKYKMHMKTHRNIRRLPCDRCEKTFANRSGLKAHSLIHENIKPYRCDICQLLFSRSSILTLHIRSHFNYKPFECPTCKKCFSRKSSMQDHVRGSHTKERIFDCEICGKSFLTYKVRKVHMRIHTKERPYQCTICMKKFNQNGALSKHMNTHKREKNHECTICDKRFYSKGNLAEHMRLHNLPYACITCRARFNHISDFNQHKKTHVEETAVKDSDSDSLHEKEPIASVKNGEKANNRCVCMICEELFMSKEDLMEHLKEHVDEI